jgi:hypothetical protein
MPKKSPYVICLSQKEGNKLEEIARKYTSSYCNVIRAKVILLAAQGFQNKQIGEQLDFPRLIVSIWRKLFFVEGFDGCYHLMIVLAVGNVTFDLDDFI